MSRPLYLALVTLFVLTWSSAFVATKFAVAVSPPTLFLGIRFLIAGALLLALAAARGELSGRAPWLTLAWLGVLNQGGYQGLAWNAMAQPLSSGLANVIASTAPIVVAALAVPLLGERLTLRRMLGLGLGFAGVAFLVRHRIAVTGESALGVVLMIGSLAAMVAGTIAFKRASPAAPLMVVVGAQQLAAGAALLPLGLALEHPGAMTIGLQFVAAMTWQIGVVSIGALMLWFLLLRRGSAGSATALHFLMPPVGLIMGWAVLSEPLGATDMLAIVPIALGIRLATRVETVPATPARA
jgi:drug/metabolite transporter (DMT)-like permease